MTYRWRRVRRQIRRPGVGSRRASICSCRRHCPRAALRPCNCRPTARRRIPGSAGGRAEGVGWRSRDLGNSADHGHRCRRRHDIAVPGRRRRHRPGNERLRRCRDPRRNHCASRRWDWPGYTEPAIGGPGEQRYGDHLCAGSRRPEPRSMPEHRLRDRLGPAAAAADAARAGGRALHRPAEHRRIARRQQRHDAEPE